MPKTKLVTMMRESFRLWVAELWMRVFPRACRAHVIMWALFDGYDLTGERDMPQSCREDAARCGFCYCGRVTEPAPAGGEARP